MEKNARHVLLLQGPLSSYYSQIAGELIKSGISVTKINFCGNDIFDWHNGRALNYVETIDNWPNYFEKLVDEHGITDILLHGDRRPYHKIAIKLARERDIKIWVTELGYLRPDWMTIEPDGGSSLSRFTNKAQYFPALEGDCKQNSSSVIYTDNVASLIFQEVRFTVFNFLFSLYFRNYVTHRKQSQFKVYSGWISSRLSKAFSFKKNAKVLIPNAPYFVMALQLEGDLQLTEHSPFRTIMKTIEYVLISFKDQAPQNSVLILKLHPHAFDTYQLKKQTKKLSQSLGISERITFHNGSSISALCQNALGFITVNSSAGFEALEAGCPTCCIMPTIYDMKGLTHQDALDSFWVDLKKPDLKLLQALKTSLSNTIQVRGTLYNNSGRKAAAKQVAHKIMDDDLSSSKFIENSPPRLDKAKLMGVKYEV